MPVRCVVVVGDEEPGLERDLAMSLTSEGFDVARPVDGREALEVAAAREPSVLILRARLPIIDALQVVTALKRNVALKHIPVIIAADARQHLPHGVVNVSNPFELGELVAHVRRAAGDPPQSA